MMKKEGRSASSTSIQNQYLPVGIYLTYIVIELLNNCAQKNCSQCCCYLSFLQSLSTILSPIMGCTGSSPKALESRSQSTTIDNKNNPLSTKEILLRIEASPETSSLVIAQTAMRYAYVSQRGYYPEG